MKALGIFLLVAHLVNLAEGAIMLATSVGALTGSGYMIASGVVNLLLWLALSGLTVNAVRLSAGVLNGKSERLTPALQWSNYLLVSAAYLSFTTGLPLAFLSLVGCGPLFVPSLYHWTGLVGMILNFAAYFLLPTLAKVTTGSPGPTSHHWATTLPMGLVHLAWGLTWIIVYAKLSGSINEKDYPDRKSSKFKLPWPGGESAWVIQGNNSSNNHTGDQKFAWDFRRRCGTPVLAAQEGDVIKVEKDNDGQGSDAKNNRIVVEHKDGTQAQYLHIQYHSNKVKVGDHVKAGDVLALVGSVGKSLTGHIHFQVDKGGKSIPVTFQDVTEDAGIPRTFGSYESGNRKVP